jgi:hypothetical protein
VEMRVLAVSGQYRSGPQTIRPGTGGRHAPPSGAGRVRGVETSTMPGLGRWSLRLRAPSARSRRWGNSSGPYPQRISGV